MNAHAVVVAMLKRKVAITVFTAVLFFLVIAEIVHNQKIPEVADIAVFVRMMVVMCEERWKFDHLFCK